MQLTDLLRKANIPYSGADCPIDGLTADSRKVGKNFLFAALPGVKADGADFLTDACGKGAVAALIPDTAAVPDLPMIFIPVADPRLALAKAAAAFYAPQPDVVVAVTGTNGKTSTANFTRQIWEFLGKKAACVGTLGVVTNDFTAYGSLTTPDSVTLCRELRDLAVKGYRHAAIEASSHGLDQHRIDGLRIAAAAFTNITRDHLDYHKTMENYLRAKLKLFDRPLSSRTVVLNADIPEYPRIAEYCREKGLKIIDYGKNAAALKLKESRMDTNGQMLTLDVFGRERTVNLPLAGTFQAMNALCALGLVLATGEDADMCVKALETLNGAPGRLEHVADRKNGAAVYVDYAHTPDALETVLNALRPHTKNRLCVVFGCGGDRD
ncbi:MAG TPA: UDP-N-acetylmuramoyl-L-alanyl-D-glutamate--2,6-diaminopimelate ligase, partial [Alphaproteobacteria bacterium]|nr:UDP-N-acetylmuramoyl-L-alanyl-D-glutamate--2,6-diaminopimelate ligase [Alphaproteobacteria bacterium]